jgi:hypothetical protein
MKLNIWQALGFGILSLILIFGLSYGAAFGAEKTGLTYLIYMPSAILAWATILLAYATFSMINNNRKQEERQRKGSVLNEIRDWIFSIKDISLEPIAEENIVFRQFNIELKYGIPMNRAKLLEIEIKKILKDQELNEKVSKVTESLVAVMVLDKARYESRNINEDVIESFPGYVNIIKKFISVIDEEANKTSKSKEGVAYDIWKKCIRELNNAETEVLDKIVSLKSEL